MPTIRSLLNQSVLPEKIYIQIPAAHLCVYESLEEKFASFDSVEVVSVSHDIGPATKWFFPIVDDNVDKTKIIMVVDDDQIYPEGIVAHYESSVSQGVASTLCGWPVPSGMNHRNSVPVCSAKTRLFSTAGLVEADQIVDIVQGASSFAFWKNDLLSVLPSIDDIMKLGHARFADDILISGLIKTAGVKVKVVPAQFNLARIANIKMVHVEALKQTVNLDDQNSNLLYSRFWKSD
ncbi:MAG: hypothetical protein ACO2ZZ_12310 [Cyclobacteriaceae bacterium]